jgi:hypothetical protein
MFEVSVNNSGAASHEQKLENLIFRSKV